MQSRDVLNESLTSAKLSTVSHKPSLIRYPSGSYGQRKEQGLQIESQLFILQKRKQVNVTLQEYKVPPEKYVVVVNPWGLPDRLDMNTKLNEIGAWFQLLLKKDYPNARVREIFYQKTVYLFYSMLHFVSEQIGISIATLSSNCPGKLI